MYKRILVSLCLLSLFGCNHKQTDSESSSHSSKLTESSQDSNTVESDSGVSFRVFIDSTRKVENEPSKTQTVSDLLQKVSQRSKGDGFRVDALEELARMGPDASEAVPALILIAEDPNESSRTHVIDTLGYIGVPTSDIVAALIRILKSSEDRYILSSTTRALGQIGPSASDAVPILIAIGNGDTWFAHSQPDAIAKALGHIGPNAKESIPFLSDILKGKNNRYVQLHAAIAILRIDPSSPIAEEAMSVLIRDLNGDFILVDLYIVAEQIGTLGAVAKPALPALERAANHEREDLRNAAAAAIIKIKKELEEEQEISNVPIVGD